MAYKNIKNIIISTACNLFREKGYDNVTINAICSCCSITKPTFYYHFKSKEDILFAHFDNTILNLDSQIGENCEFKSGLDEFLYLIESVMEAIRDLGYDFVQNLITGSIKRIDHSILIPEKYVHKCVTALAKGQKDGSIANATEPEKLFFLVYNSFLGYIFFWCQHNGLIESEIRLQDIISSILKSLYTG